MLNTLEMTLEANLKMVKNIKKSPLDDASIETVTYIIINELHKMTTDILRYNLFIKS